MARPVIIKEAAATLLEHLVRMGSDRKRWRVAILHGSEMDEPHKRMLLMRESLTSVHEIINESDMAAYFCEDADIIFTFTDSFAHAWPVLQKILQEMLPYLNPGEIDFRQLFTFYELSHDFDRVTYLLRAKVFDAMSIKTPVEIPLLKQRTYIWNDKNFAQALNRRDARSEPLAAVVEDDFTVRQLARDVIRTHYSVMLAANGYEALELYNSYAPELVFLDIELPFIDGLHVLKMIMRADPKANIVMFTSHKNRETLQQAMMLGAKGFVSKPFTVDKLLQHARQAFGDKG